MLESLLKFGEINKRPWLVFIWALMISSIGILFASQLAYQIKIYDVTIDLMGLFSVIFTIIPSVYFITLIIKREEAWEEKEIKKHYSKAFWQRHEKDVIIFLFYFFGLTLSFAIWSFLLPMDSFQIQLMKITEIQGSITGEELASFTDILTNNLEIVAFAFIFSLLFGAGAIFIIVWNASILGVYIGRLSKSLIEIPTVTLGFLPHGIPEISGYLLAGLAGGLLSAAVIRGHGKEILKIISIDSIKLLLLATFFVILGAGIETLGYLYKIVFLLIFYTIFILMLFNALFVKR